MGNVLTKFTYGMYVVGVRAGDVRNGMAASWAAQVSFEPKRAMVAVKKTRFTHSLLDSAGAFTISVLRRDQADILERFKGEKEVTETTIGGVPVIAAENGAPALADCLGYIELEKVHAFDAGDHTLFVGEVTRMKTISEGGPLTSSDLNGHFYGG